nr:ABC transporter ATP-binding protein [Lachnospiraceae bacterium]
MNESLEKLKKIVKSPAMRKISTWTKCVHGKIFWICVLQMVIVLCALGETLVTKNLIDAATSFDVDNLIRFAVALVIMILLEVAFGALISVLRTKASAKLQSSMQEMFIKDWFQKEYASLKDFHSGELVNRIFSDVGVIKSGVLGILPDIVSMGVGFVGAAAILIALDWRFVLLLVIAGAIGIVIVLLFRNPMKKRHKKMQEAEDRLHAIMQESFENLRLIKASSSEGRVTKKIGARQKALENEQVRQGLFSVAMNNGMGLMFDFTWLFCMIWGSAAIFRGELTYGSLAAMIQLIGRVQGPISDAVGIAGDVYRMISSAERLMELSE